MQREFPDYDRPFRFSCVVAGVRLDFRGRDKWHAIESLTASAIRMAPERGVQIWTVCAAGREIGLEEIVDGGAYAVVFRPGAELGGVDAPLVHRGGWAVEHGQPEERVVPVLPDDVRQAIARNRARANRA